MGGGHVVAVEQHGTVGISRVCQLAEREILRLERDIRPCGLPRCHKPAAVGRAEDIVAAQQTRVQLIGDARIGAGAEVTRGAGDGVAPNHLIPEQRLAGRPDPGQVRDDAGQIGESRRLAFQGLDRPERRLGFLGLRPARPGREGEL